LSDIISLNEDAVCAVHDLLSGHDTNLAKILAESKHALALGVVIWSVPVTPITVHKIVTICLFATEHGISIQLQPPRGLSHQESIFHQDFLLRGLPQSESKIRKFKLALHENKVLMQDALKILLNLKSLLAKPVIANDSGIETALLIGQYGGEHVGDAAILGGVLFHLHRDYGTSKAHLLSHRPEHTQRLVNGLQTPVTVEVHPSSNRQIEILLDQAQGLVFAGGPIMDLPRVLAKQVAVACSARRRGLPIVIDRVGIGPFKRQASRSVARRIVRLASSLSVRTKAAASDSIVANLHPAVLRDPAFEYLATRAELTRLSKQDVDSVRQLVSGTRDRYRIGINLRPIRHLWSPQGELFSSRAAERFINQFSMGLVAFAECSPLPPSYIFFPMNPQEFGMSDLRIAYELHSRLGDKVDFRVWQGDPDVDGVLHLLRILDCAITMRFHACIFAITQKIPTLGIDYYPGQGGKVEQLFADAERGDNACRMDTFDVRWLLDSLKRMEPEMRDRLNTRI
jgi:polysaccharide pyruvyl transferase WcaK-like protein